MSLPRAPRLLSTEFDVVVALFLLVQTKQSGEGR